MGMMVVALFVAIAATNDAMAMEMGNNCKFGNIVVIIATGIANSGGVVSGGAINDFGYGTKFGTQPGKVIIGKYSTAMCSKN